MTKKSNKNLPIYEYEKKINGQTRYYCRPYINGVQTTIRLDEHGEMWLGKYEFQSLLQYLSRVSAKDYQIPIIENKHITLKELYKLKIQNDEMYNKNGLSTRVTYNYKVKKHLMTSALADMEVSKITIIDINNYAKELANKTIETGSKAGTKLNYRYLNSCLRDLVIILKFGNEQYNLGNKAYLKINYFKENRDIVKEVNLLDCLKQNVTLSTKTWEKFINAGVEIVEEEPDKEKKQRYKKMLLLFSIEYILVMRIGEVQAMRYKNIHGNLYVLYEAYCKTTNKISPPKNRRARIVYIPPSLLNLINEAKMEDMLASDFNENDFIFGKDKPYARNTLDRFRRKIIDKANIEYFTNHYFRHAGESYALSRNVDMSALADMAGHDKKIMLETYIQTTEESNAYLLETLNSIRVPEFK